MHRLESACPNLQRCHSSCVLTTQALSPDGYRLCIGQSPTTSVKPQEQTLMGKNYMICTWMHPTSSSHRFCFMRRIHTRKSLSSLFRYYVLASGPDDLCRKYGWVARYSVYIHLNVISQGEWMKCLVVFTQSSVEMHEPSVLGS